jgi:imidazolonepropionase-like amidohydrolase
MSFCDHCEGQRFDRAQVLRTLRAVRKTLPKKSRADEALTVAINAVRVLDIPHLEQLDDSIEGQQIH